MQELLKLGVCTTSDFKQTGTHNNNFHRNKVSGWVGHISTPKDDYYDACYGEYVDDFAMVDWEER